MQRLLTVLVLCLAAVTPALTQDPIRVYTNPELPSREVLNRLNLKLAWIVRLPTEGVRDGIASLQLLPSEGREQVLVQTLRGLVILLDAETGDTLWRTYVGQPYDPAQPAGYSEQNIYATRREQFYILNRATGNQRLYQVDKKAHTVFGMALQSAPTAAPVADEDAVFLVRDLKVTAYLIPRYAVTEKAKAQEAAEKGLPAAVATASSDQPTYIWNTLTYGVSVLTPAVLGQDSLAVIGGDGTFISLNKYEGKERFRYRVQGSVSAPMGQYGNIAYVGSDDFTLYALHLTTGRLHWRFQAGGPIDRQPYVTEQDVFVSAKRSGFFRVDRDSGEARWRSREAVQFLAANQKFVYASDRHGKLLVLDYLRGTTLATYDLSGFNVPYGNELTDRILLSAHDGTLICLHHRDNAAPFRVRPLPKKAVPKEEPPAGELKKEEMKKEEEKKDVEKKDVEKKDVEKKDVEKKDVEKKEEEKKDVEKKEEEKKDVEKKEAEKKDAGEVGMLWERLPAEEGPALTSGLAAGATWLAQGRGGQEPLRLGPRPAQTGPALRCRREQLASGRFLDRAGDGV